MALLQHGGVALFVLVFLYVWFNNHARVQELQERLSDNATSFSDTLSMLGPGRWDIILIFTFISLVLLVIMLTSLRALSNHVKGTPFDSTPLYIAMSWVLKDKLVHALVAGTVLTGAMVMLMVLGHEASQAGLDTIRNAPLELKLMYSTADSTTDSSDDSDRSLLDDILLMISGLCTFAFLCISKTLAFLLAPASPLAVARTSLVRAALLVSMLGLLVTTVLVYADVSVAKDVPVFSRLFSWSSSNASLSAYTISDYRRDLQREHPDFTDLMKLLQEQNEE